MGKVKPTLLMALDEAFDRRSWHGTNLSGSIRRVKLRQAAFRPQPTRHNISEIVVHTAYWKYVVRRRITGAKRGSFPLQGSDWLPRTDPLLPETWREDMMLLQEDTNSCVTQSKACRRQSWRGSQENSLLQD